MVGKPHLVAGELALYSVVIGSAIRLAVRMVCQMVMQGELRWLSNTCMVHERADIEDSRWVSGENGSKRKPGHRIRWKWKKGGGSGHLVGSGC